MGFEIKDGAVILAAKGGMDPAVTFDCGQCFRWREEADRPGVFTGFIGRDPCEVEMEEDLIHIRPLCADTDMRMLGKASEEYFDCRTDYPALKERFGADPVMKEAVEFAPGIRVLNQPFFETLVSFIISQNNNIPRIRKIIEALCETYGEKRGDMYAFPTPERLASASRDDLFALRMGFRARYVRDAVEKVLSGEVRQEDMGDMTTPEASKYLEKISGVGPKVAGCVLLFSCGRHDSFPRDVWINRRIRLLFGGDLPGCIEGEEGIAQQYIFQYARFNLEKGQ